MNNSPLNVNVEITTRCNLKCPICLDNFPELNVDKSWKAMDMDIELYKRVAASLFPGAKTAILQGSGEPLFCKHWDEEFEIATKYEVDIAFFTNGTCFTQKRMDAMIDYAEWSGKQVDIHFSIDGATAKTNERIRGKGSFDRAIAAMEYIRDNRGTTDVRFGCNMILMRHNIRELPDMMRLTKELGGYCVYGTHLIVYAKETDAWHLKHERQLADDMLREARRIGVELGLVMNLPEYFHSEETDYKAESSVEKGVGQCTSPFDTIFVKSNGQVIPCCAMIEPFGDANAQDALEIWRTGKFEETREMFRNGMVPKYCTKCPLVDIRNQKLTVKEG